MNLEIGALTILVRLRKVLANLSSLGASSFFDRFSGLLVVRIATSFLILAVEFSLLSKSILVIEAKKSLSLKIPFLVIESVESLLLEESFLLVQATEQVVHSMPSVLVLE